MGTYSSGGAGWILLDISITALTSPVTFSYTLSLERSKLAVGGGLIKAVIEMSNRIQPAAPEEYVPMVKVGSLCIFSH